MQCLAELRTSGGKPPKVIAVGMDVFSMSLLAVDEKVTRAARYCSDHPLTGQCTHGT